MREMFLAYNSKQPDLTRTIGWEMREIAVPEKVTSCFKLHLTRC